MVNMPFERFGDPQTWVIPADDIERIMTHGVCIHTLSSIEECEDCFTDALFARQMTILAERLGCTPEDATAVGEKMAREQRDRIGR